MKGLKRKYFLAKMYSNNLFNLKHKKNIIYFLQCMYLPSWSEYLENDI